MLNVGGGELLLVLMVALIVLGPTKLPVVVRQVGRAVGELKRLSQSFQAEIDAVANLADEDVERQARQRGAEAANPSTTAPDPDPGKPGPVDPTAGSPREQP